MSLTHNKPSTKKHQTTASKPHIKPGLQWRRPALSHHHHICAHAGSSFLCALCLIVPAWRRQRRQRPRHVSLRKSTQCNWRPYHPLMRKCTYACAARTYTYPHLRAARRMMTHSRIFFTLLSDCAVARARARTMNARHRRHDANGFRPAFHSLSCPPAPACVYTHFPRTLILSYQRLDANGRFECASACIRYCYTHTVQYDHAAQPYLFVIHVSHIKALLLLPPRKFHASAVFSFLHARVFVFFLCAVCICSLTRSRAAHT